MSLSKKFSNDHFTHNLVRWYEYIVPRLQNRNVKVLIVGAFEGRAVLFLLEKAGINLSRSMIYCVDSYKDVQILSNLKHNLRPYSKNVRVYDGDISYILRKFDPNEITFDFIYISSEHAAKYQVEYGVLSLPLLKARGILGFHNYTNSKEHNTSCPKKGIDNFIDMYASDVKVLTTSWEVFMLKRANPMKTKYCYSELYHEDLSQV